MNLKHLPVVIKRYGYRQAKGVDILIALPDFGSALEKALAESIGEAHAPLNHTVYKCVAQSREEPVYLWFRDGAVYICDDIFFEREGP